MNEKNFDNIARIRIDPHIHSISYRRSVDVIFPTSSSDAHFCVLLELYSEYPRQQWADLRFMLLQSLANEVKSVLAWHYGILEPGSLIDRLRTVFDRQPLPCVFFPEIRTVSPTTGFIPWWFCTISNATETARLISDDSEPSSDSRVELLLGKQENIVDFFGSTPLSNGLQHYSRHPVTLIIPSNDCNLIEFICFCDPEARRSRKLFDALVSVITNADPG